MEIIDRGAPTLHPRSNFIRIETRSGADAVVGDAAARGGRLGKCSPQPAYRFVQERGARLNVPQLLFCIRHKFLRHCTLMCPYPQRVVTLGGCVGCAHTHRTVKNNSKRRQTTPQSSISCRPICRAAFDLDKFPCLRFAQKFLRPPPGDSNLLRIGQDNRSADEFVG